MITGLATKPGMVLGLATALLCSALLAQDAPLVHILDIDGAIGPATTDYLARSLSEAETANASAVVLRMNTPGGLDAATREINQLIISSETPVVSYVAPEGARAASAGTYILYASHFAAMAPATNIGAATPVQIMGGGRGNADEADEEDTMGRKVVNDSVAYIRGLAELRGRNIDWAEKAVRDAASIGASEALELGVIEIIATDIDELLSQLDGKTTTIAGEPIELNLTDAKVVNKQPDWRSRLLSTVTDPTIAYLLFLVGIYGLLFEGYNPGALVPGVVGAVCLLLALYAFQVVPINAAGIALLILGIALLIAEAFVPSFGALGIGGAAAFILGSIMMFDGGIPGYEISRSVIGGIATAFALVLFALAWTAVKMRRGHQTSGKQALVGARGAMISDDRVEIGGENWLVRANQRLRSGDQVEVESVDGLVLEVVKIFDREELK